MICKKVIEFINDEENISKWFKEQDEIKEIFKKILRIS